MKVTLYLMTQKGFDVLTSLLANNYQKYISKVIVGKDKNIENDFSNEIKDLCLNSGIVVYERIASYEIDSTYSVAVSWRWLIPEGKSVLIVLHDSILPKYRGFAPLVNMLINKEENIGVTALYATDEYDKGDIIGQEIISIQYPITIQGAIDKVSASYCVLINRIFSQIAAGQKIKSVKQDESRASYSCWRDDDDYFIMWEKTSDEIVTFINAVSSPYIGASAMIHKDQKIRILEAEIVNDVKVEIRDLGKVIFVENGKPVVVCGSGLIKINKAIDEQTKESIIPLKSFRIRFSSP